MLARFTAAFTGASVVACRVAAASEPKPAVAGEIALGWIPAHAFVGGLRPVLSHLVGSDAAPHAEAF